MAPTRKQSKSIRVFAGQNDPAPKSMEGFKFMRKTSSLKCPAVFSRIAYLALLFMTMSATTLHLGAVTAQAAQAALSWSAPTTNTDGTAIKNLAGYKVYTGTASGNYSQNVNVGNVTSYTSSTLNDGTTYYFAVTAFDATGNTSGYSNQASFTTAATPPTTALYTLTASAGSGGTITPSGATIVSSGTSQSYTITPGTGYQVAGVTVDGASVGAVTSYSFSKVAANHSISATFSTATAATYTIMASTGTGGSVTPAGATSLAAGASKSYTVTPSTGYYVASVLVDGTSVAANIAGGAAYSYAFSSVSANHTISATFAVRSYHIVATAGANGTVTPADSWVVYNTSQAMTFTPASGYQVANVTLDGTSLGAVSSYTFNNTAADHTLSVTFGVKVPTYTITASAAANGTITPSKTVNQGSSQSFTVTPNTGYYVISVTVDGTTVASNLSSGGYSYAFSNVTANHTISATFGVRYYEIAASAGTNGSVTPANTWVLYNTPQTVTITPASGHKIATVLVDGVSIGAVSSYTFSNVSAAHTLQATFL
jgi:hypothetical protein